MALQRLQDLKQTIVELAVLTKMCLTTFWFWVPPLFATYMYLQLWMIFFIHPITLVILPTILLVYSVVQENKRTKAMYGLNVAKRKLAGDPLGERPHEFDGFRWEVEKALDNYEKTLQDKKEESPESDS
jgi:hypothetical protein